MKALLALIHPAFEWTWNNSLQVAVLVVLVLLVQKALGRWLTPRLRYALSLLVLLRLLLPAAPPSSLSLQNLWPKTTPPAIPQATAPTVAESARPPAIAFEPLPVDPVPAPPAASPTLTVPTPPSRTPVLSLTEVLALAWTGGLIALVSLAGCRYVQWCRSVHCGRQLSDARCRALLEEARRAMGVYRPVTLVAMARLSTPAVFGCWRVRLLLPETAVDQLTDQELRLLFLHEMAHVRRQDMLLNLLLMAVQFVHWFNPLVWLGLHRLRTDRELVCDAMVLQRTKPEERLGYGTLLLKLLTDAPASLAMIPTAVPVVSSKGELKRRIILIKRHRRATLVACLATGLAALALACGTFTGQSQQPTRDSSLRGSDSVGSRLTAENLAPTNNTAPLQQEPLGPKVAQTPRIDESPLSPSPATNAPALLATELLAEKHTARPGDPIGVSLGVTNQSPLGFQEEENPAVRERIDKLLAQLKDESLQRSIDQIIHHDNEWVDFAPVLSRPQFHMEVIFASRRTLKVIQSLETLPAAEREATCAQIFAKAFQIHTNTYWVAMRSREDPSAPTNRQSMLSTLMAMCTAMFATAELGRSDMLLRQFAQLDEFQQQFERRLAAHGNSYPAGLIGVLKDLLKPDNRLQLNVLRLAVASGGGGNRQQLLARFDAECGHMDLRTEELTITRWDARTTAFDNRWPHMNSPVDTRGGVTKCVFYAWINPEDVEAHPGLQEGQIRKLRQIVGEAHATRQAAVAAPVETELKQLVDKYLPGCKVQYDGEGKPNTLSSPEGTFLDLKGASSVASAQPGYWSSPMMELLSRQSLKVESESDAVDVVKLLHALCYGPSFVKQKVYHPRAFEGGWLIEVDHDHKNYPGNVSFVHPYELLVDARINVTQFRQRCYTYLGSASVYSNTVVSVYEREKRVNGGSRYPEALRRELKEAWEKEKQQQTGKAKAQEELQRLQPAQDSSLRGTNSVGIEDPVEYLRMEALVTTLGRETWDQSVANLVTNVNQFLERSPFLPTGAMLGAEMDLLEMLSVRRAIKILNTLQALPMSQRVEKCRELFYRLLREYADAKERQLGLGSSPPEKPPYCTPHALCVAMFATAETGRRDILAEEFLRLDELRRRVENLMADNKAACSEVARKAGAPNYEFWKLWALRTCAPDARFQLNVLRLAVLRDPHAPDNLLKEIDAYCHSKDMTAMEVPIVPWDARTTVFERLVGSPPDTSKGVTKYMIYDWGGAARDEVFLGEYDLKREVVQKVRELALGAANGRSLLEPVR